MINTHNHFHCFVSNNKLALPLRIKKKAILLDIAAIFGTMALLLPTGIIAPVAAQEANSSSDTKKCVRCVIFELHDVEDFGYSNAQVAVMDLFLDAKKPLSLGIIAGPFGNTNYTNVLGKVKEGVGAGLFEAGMEGLTHANYANMTYAEQVDDFKAANDKIESTLGVRPSTFLPPFSTFNQDSIKALADLGMERISSSYWYEKMTPNSYKVSDSSATGDTVIPLSVVNGTKIFHVPFNTSLLGLTREGFEGQALIAEVLGRANTNISKYGFSVIVLHPTDFAAVDPATGNLVNQADPEKLQMLSDILDQLELKGYSFEKYDAVVGNNN